MKAVIPAAGQGTRLYPHTHTKPKAMVRLAGRPILGHILSSLAETPIDEVVTVVGGPMQTQITEYARNEFGDRFEFAFPEEETAEGLGHAVYQARDVVGDESVLIALGDMLFESGYGSFLAAHHENGDSDGSIGTKPVAEPQHYGIVEVDGDGSITRLVEKPDDPPSDLAISGVYVIEESRALFDTLGHLIENDVRGAGDEYQLTDALQRMVEEGYALDTFEVQDWYDCGRPETLLEANRVLLGRVETSSADLDNAVVIPPVDFGDDVSVVESVVGPNVSIDDGATIHNSIVRESIVGKRASLEMVNLEESIVGTNAHVGGEATQLNLGDNSSIEL